MSIIIPVYNGEAYVAEAVRSALEQDYPAKEIIVVNDGSTDRTAAVLRQFGKAVLVVDQLNGGPPRARNTGMAKASGEYIAFLDADDVWLPGKISLQIAQLETNPSVGACYTDWHVWHADRNGAFLRPEFSLTPLRDATVDPQRSGWIYGRLLFDCEMLTTTVMVRTAVAREVGVFDVERWCGEDYDYWIRLSRHTKIARLNAIGALYRVVQGSASRRPREINDELVVIERAIARYGLTDPGGVEIDASAVRRRLDRLVFQHGHAHFRRGDPAVAFRAFKRNLLYRPLRPKLWLYALNSLARGYLSKSRLPTP